MLNRPFDLPADLVAEVSAVAEEEGCTLIAARFRGNRLQLLLDREDGGVTLEDCETVSRQVSALLDVADFGDRKYTLEVSSPGLDRELFGPADFERFTGNRVRVTFRPQGGDKRTLVGRLAAFHSDRGGEIEVSEQEPSGSTTIPLSDIQVARLEIEL